jgi:hypothetical protein
MKIQKIREKQRPLGSIRKNLSKFDKLASYEQIPRPWLHSFIVIGLWGR